MTRLEAVIERLRTLPENQQEVVAEEIESLLATGGSILSPEQWAEVEREIDEDDGVRIPHADVMARMKARFG